MQSNEKGSTVNGENLDSVFQGWTVFSSKYCNLEVKINHIGNLKLRKIRELRIIFSLAFSISLSCFVYIINNNHIHYNVFSIWNVRQSPFSKYL
jgi:hypothetical protein